VKNELLSALFDRPSAVVAFRSASKRVCARTETRFLDHHHVLRLERKQQFKKILVRSGVLWLTSTPAAGDVILGQGETFEFQNAWPYVIEAIEAAEISLTQ
jgi:Protein of unknown function (DUF2917)